MPPALQPATGDRTARSQAARLSQVQVTRGGASVLSVLRQDRPKELARPRVRAPAERPARRPRRGDAARQPARSGASDARGGGGREGVGAGDARRGDARRGRAGRRRSEEHTSELQSLRHLVCRLLLEKKKKRRTQEQNK